MAKPIILGVFEILLEELRKRKPGDRSERDRKFAICITEAEKLRALVIGLIGEFINE